MIGLLLVNQFTLENCSHGDSLIVFKIKREKRNKKEWREDKEIKRKVKRK